jgi:hypothetical protein
MQTSDWVLLGTSIGLATVALIAPYVGARLIAWWRRPKLVVTYKHAPPNAHKTYFKERKSEHEVYYFRFEVFNDGRSPADACEAVLEELWCANSANQLRKIENFSPVNFKGSTPLNRGEC